MAGAKGINHLCTEQYLLTIKYKRNGRIKNYQFPVTSVITETSNNHQWILKAVGIKNVCRFSE